MNILGEEAQPLSDEENARLCESAIVRASHGDWRAASWWLQNAPAARNEWGETRIREEFSQRILAKCVSAIAESGLPVEWERRVLLSIQSRVGDLPPAEAEV